MVRTPAFIALRLLPAIVMGWTTLHPAPARADDADVPQAIRDAIAEHFRKSFVVPYMVLWKFDFTRPYPTGGTAICGRVNYPGSTHRYKGDHAFYARIQKGVVTDGAIVSTSVAEDPTHITDAAYRIACVQ